MSHQHVTPTGPSTAAVADTAAAAAPPTFLVGAERSGTSLLRLMLDHHPDVAFFSEFEFVVTRWPSDETFPTVEQFCRSVEGDRIFLGSGFTIDRSLDFADLARSFLDQKRLRDGKRFVGATVHYEFHRLLRIWPDAKFIHIVRDPRDVARSAIDMGWASNGLVGAQKWRHAEELWEEVAADLPAGRSCDISYEELILDPESTLRRAAGVIGVDYHADMMSYTKDSTYSKPDPKLIGQWKHKSPASQVQVVEAFLGPLMTSRGYALSDLPRIELTPEDIHRLQRQNHHAWIRTRINRLGLPLFTADVVTRRLGLRHWQERIRKRMLEIEDQYVKK